MLGIDLITATPRPAAASIRAMVTPAAIEAYVPTPEEVNAWDAERDLMVKLTFGSLVIKGDQPNDFGKSEEQKG